MKTRAFDKQLLKRTTKPANSDIDAGVRVAINSLQAQLSALRQQLAMMGANADYTPEGVAGPSAIQQQTAGLVNKSGTARTYGDVVVINPAFEGAFKTTTTEGDTTVIGVVAQDSEDGVSDDVAIDATARVCTGGLAEVLVEAPIAPGDFLVTSTTAGRAKAAESRSDAGIFAVALEEVTTGTEIIDALIVLSPINYQSVFTALSEPTGFEDRTTSTISMTGRDFYIEPLAPATSFNVWIKGVVQEISTTLTLEISNVTGLHAIYVDTDGTLGEYVNPDYGDTLTLIRDKAWCAIAYWNATESELVYFGEERHGCIMSGLTHYYNHYKSGLQLFYGLGLGDFVIGNGSSDTHAQFSVEGGSVSDEDLGLTIDAIGSTTGMPIFYREGAAGAFRVLTQAGFSVYANPAGATNRLMWNEWTGATWQLTEVGNNDYVLCHVFATTGKAKQMYAIMGQGDYATLPAARAGATTEIAALVLGDLPTVEFRPVATVIFQTDKDYGNAVNARIVQAETGVDYVDWRTSELPRGIAPTDHANLSGLQGGEPGQYNHVDNAELADVQDIPDYKERNNLENEFNDDYTDAYSEITYTTGLATAVDTWEDSGKTDKLFSKTISYNVDDQIDEVELTDEKTSAVLTTTITYNVDGTVATITKAIT